MSRSLAAGFAAAALLTMATAGIGTASADESWEMPSFQGMTLAEANSVMSATTADAGPKLSTRVIHTAPQIPFNPATWEVCGQKPSPGASITASSSVAVAIAPPNMC
ncbi:hypothetical protein [Mycolicibacterium sp.]|uniref:hypothetical protein n=1 Tax=Mycolicibacterium sp. TaxID=2320850 RepID=UPI003D10D071